MENLFLSVTTHMKSKWTPLHVFSPPPAEGTSLSPAPGESQHPNPSPRHPQRRPLVSWRKRRHPLAHWPDSVYPHRCPDLPELSTWREAAGMGQYGQPPQPLPGPHKDSGVGRLWGMRSGSFPARHGPVSVLCTELLVHSSFRLGHFISMGGNHVIRRCVEPRTPPA